MGWGIRIIGVGLLAALAGQGLSQTAANHKKKTSGAAAAKHPAAGHASTHRAAALHGPAKGKTATDRHAASARTLVKETPESRRLTLAFTASSQLRPMAQQLIATRSAAAYNGVLAYAASHSGEAAAAAELALGHAYALDRRFSEAESVFRQASQHGQSLADYADYLGAQAAVQGGRPTDAYGLLDHFTERHPGSLFVPTAPILLANAYLAAGDAASAVRLLQPLQSGLAGGHTDFRFTLGKAYQASGNIQQAAVLYRGIYVGDPLSSEADGAKKQLAAMNVPLTVSERKQHADAMFNAKHYEIAQGEYRALQKDEAELMPADRDALEIMRRSAT